MRKYYHPAGTPHRCGSANHAHWDNLWSATAFEEAYRAVEDHFLRDVFQRIFPKPGKILEAGCGLGQYVAYYRQRGYDIEGVDSSTVGIEKVKARHPELSVQVADIRQLPYASGSLKVYFSGGVMEHFENGPWEAMAEARRVLADDGRLIMTVPFMNRARALRDAFPWWRGDHYRVVSAFGPQPPAPAGREFYQYAFTRSEIVRTVRKTGFEPVEMRPVQIVWGAKKLFGRQGTSVTRPVNEITPASTNGARASKPAAGWQRALLTEQAASAPGRMVLNALAGAVGHMMLLVCRKAPQ